jgi:hypothetical protein
MRSFTPQIRRPDMKTATLAALALLACGSAFAADQPSAPSATPVAKHPSVKACNKMADEKKLSGDDRSTFVKNCHAGKKGDTTAAPK